MVCVPTDEQEPMAGDYAMWTVRYSTHLWPTLKVRAQEGGCDG